MGLPHGPRRCKTFLIDPPTTWIAGSIYALVSRRLLTARRPDPFGPSAWAAVGFATFYWLSVSWMVVRAPDWMLSYFLPHEQVNLWLVQAGFVIALVLAGLSGHTLTAVMLQRGSRLGAWASALAGTAVLFVLWGSTFAQYQVIGSYTQWMDGSAVPLTQSPLALDLNVIGVVDAFAFVVPLVLLIRASRRLRPS